MSNKEFKNIKRDYGWFFERQHMSDEEIRYLFNCYAQVLDGDMSVAEFECEVGLSIFDMPFRMRTSE